MLKLVILVCVSFALAISAPISDELVIQLPDGQIQGTTYTTRNNNTYFGFQGIPYATPPTGSLRFEIRLRLQIGGGYLEIVESNIQAPQQAQPWEGIWDATRDSKACLSASHENNPTSESEDCLYINVYTPEIKPAFKLPVMLWIFGGAFTRGSSAKSLYGPDFLVEKGVIVVSFNYRLGAFGFLSTGDSAIRGNAGLKDQNMAMKWTHENIKYFGGDPEKITIFGQSAGGASTGLHFLSKQSTGLFRAAIIESGSALTYWTIDQDPKSYALSLVETLNGRSYENDTQNLKKFLQEKTPEEILNATRYLPNNGHQIGPVLEVEDDGAFLTESPYELLASGRFNQVPIMIGACSEESLMFLKDLNKAKEYAVILDLIPSILIPFDLKSNSSDDKAVIKEIKDIYLDEGETFLNNLAALAEWLSDQGFTRGVIKHAELAASYVPVYLYQFSYYGRVITEAFIDGAEKAGHGAELPFLFDSVNISDTTLPADLLTQDRMTTLWTNFVKFLNPTPESSELLDNIIWPAVSPIAPINLQYLNINGSVEIRSNLKEHSYQSWNNIYEKYGKKPFITY